MRKRLRKKKLKALVCDDCGKQGDDVKETICPYDNEIYNKEVPCVICDNCYNLRSYEI